MTSDSVVQRCAQIIRAKWTTKPRAAIVLGTGLGGLAEHIRGETIYPNHELPEFPRPTAVAHSGRLVCGHLADVPVVAMQGRVHYYEGYEFSRITLPVRVAAELGCALLIVSNASGGLNPQFNSGDIMVIDDHIDLMGSCFFGESAETLATPRLKHSGYYDQRCIDLALQIGRRENFGCHRGVYVAVTGPNYETRAEYRFMRQIGGDAVGMSTVPEAIAARQAGMRVLALSAVTNVAKPDAPDTVDAMDVVDIAQHAEPRLRAITMGVLKSL
jgi:purine-nucleoside phosphorylase